MSIKSAEKVLIVLKELRGHSLSGVSLSQLANKLNETPSQVHRALQTLINQNFVRKDEHDLYYLSTAFISIAKAHDKELQLAQARIDEIKHLTL